jgi:endonuclease/exonuclease/phosphatase (EEP) superfamily protein YafD
MKILLGNILYGGVQINNNSPKERIYDWLKIHWWKLISNNVDGFKNRFIVQKFDIVANIISTHQPDILILNEVMPYIDKTKMALLDNGYKFVIGFDSHKNSLLTNAVIIASKTKILSKKFKMIENAGGGSVGAYIPKFDTLILSAHPSAFVKYKRTRQLRDIRLQITNLQNKYKKIIFAGDLNAQVDEVLPILGNIGMKHYTSPSFPAPNIYNNLMLFKRFWLIRKLILSKHGLPRAIDYIFYTPNIKLECKSIDIGSDHLGIVGVSK